MISYRTRDGAACALGDRLGGGGEAAIFKLASRPDLVAKVYTQARPGYEQKLASMIANPPGEPQAGHRTAAWPLEMLYDSQGQLAGYVMPRVKDAVPLVSVYNPQLRRKTLPGFTPRYLLRAAMNLASAFAAVHASGYVIGDVNEGNALVTNTALVTLVDADSFQVRNTVAASPAYFLCPVHKPEYTPPEMFGQDPRAAVRSTEQDCFGLAALIFLLLMGGQHPFRGRWLGAGEPPSLEDKIRRGLFPHFGACPDLAPPPGSDLGALDAELAALIRRCFLDGFRDPSARPSAREWADALRRVDERLFALEAFLDALRADDDDRIVEAHRPALDAHPQISAGHRRRLAQARQRRDAHLAFQAALATGDERRIARSCPRELLDAYTGATPEGRRRLAEAIACVEMPQRVREALAAGNDERVHAAYDRALERPFTDFTADERQRIDAARRRWEACRRLRQALASRDDWAIRDADDPILRGYRWLTAEERRQAAQARKRLDRLDALRRAVLAGDDRAILVAAGGVPVDYPPLLGSERARIALAKRRAALAARIAQAMAADDDALLAACDPGPGEAIAGLAGRQRERFGLARRRTEALARWRIALAAGGDAQIRDSYDAVLDGDQRVAPAERERLALARDRLAALARFRAALASGDEARMEADYASILDDCPDVTPAERERLGRAIRRSALRRALERAAACDDDAAILAAWATELRDDPGLDAGLRRRAELAARRIEAVGRLRDALASDDDGAILAARAVAEAVDPATADPARWGEPQASRLRLALARRAALAAFRRVLAQAALSGDDAAVERAYDAGVLDGCGLVAPAEWQALAEIRRRLRQMQALRAALAQNDSQAVARAFNPALLAAGLDAGTLKRIGVARAAAGRGAAAPAVD